MRLTGTILVGAMVSLACAGTTAASTTTYHFSNITNNSATNAAAGESQLRMDVSEIGGKAQLRLYHFGSVHMVVTQVHFDDRAPRLGSGESPGGSGVSFGLSGAPPVLPGGNALSPAFASSMRYTAMNPSPFNGVGPGDELILRFSFLSGGLADLLADLKSGSLRIGVRVQAFQNGGSESFVNGVPTDGTNGVIPLPNAAGLGLAGLLGLASLRRRSLTR